MRLRNFLKKIKLQSKKREKRFWDSEYGKLVMERPTAKQKRKHDGEL